MQLHPFYATVTRPVFHDSHGFLFLAVDCPECGGTGEVEYANDVPWRKSSWGNCEHCRGEGKLYEQTCEDELNDNSEEK